MSTAWRHLFVGTLAALLGARLGAALGPLREVEPFTPSWVDLRKDEDHKGDWCHLSSVNVPERGALKGYSISVVFPIDTKDFMSQRDSSGRVIGGYLIQVFDELARRAGFSWHGFIYNGTTRSETYADHVFELTEKYDVYLGSVTISTPRRMKGLIFGFPLADTSPILVGVVKRAHPSLMHILLNFLKPFDKCTWTVLLIALVFTATVYVAVEWSGDDIKDHTGKFSHALGQALFLTMGSFTGGAGLGPATRQGKLLVLAWTFAVLLLISAYTANLASLLVVTSSEHSAISSIADAVDRRLPLCVDRGTSAETAMLERYPAALLRSALPFLDGQRSLKSLGCAGVVMDTYEWEAMKHQTELNPGCKMDSIGKHLLKYDASLASHPRNCSSKLIHIINAMLQDMYEDGWLEQSFSDNMERVSEQECLEGVGQEGEHDEEGSLTILHTGSIFALTFVGSLAALAWRCYEDRRRLHDEPDDETDSDDEAEQPLKA